MLRLLTPSLHRSWLLLVLATCATFWLRSEEFVGLSVGVGTLAIAYFKGRLVILDFMELRHAPFLWRGIVEGWLLLITTAILALYAMA